MKIAVATWLMIFSLHTFAFGTENRTYPFANSVNQLVEKTNELNDKRYFGRAAGRCAAMFRSMHILLARDDPSQPHPTLERYYGGLIDVYRKIGIGLSTSAGETKSSEMPEQWVKDATAFMQVYVHWMGINKQRSGEYIEHSPALKQELKDCKEVLEISGVL